jgi:uncharacterized membrane protein (DUF485 family)
MAEPLAPRGVEPQAARTEDQPHLEIDWEAIEREPEFRELVRRRRAFVLPATIFFLVWYMAFIVVTALSPDFMGERVYEGLTVGYVYALTQFVMVFALGIWYLRKSANEFDPLAERAVARYADEHPDEARKAQEAFEHGEGRFVGERAQSSQEALR